MTALDRPHPEAPDTVPLFGVHRITGPGLPAFRERARAIQERLIARGVMAWPAGYVPPPLTPADPEARP